AVYGEEAISDRAARKWFSRFTEGYFDLSDSASPRRSTKWTRELAEKIGCGHVTVSRHLLSMGKVQKMGSWVPHQLCRDDKIRRVSAAGSLLARYRQAVAQRRPFLSQIITSDEKWCLYFNMKQTKEWLSPGKDPTPRAKPKLHERKIMPSVWWDCVCYTFRIASKEQDYHRHNLCGIIMAFGERSSAEKAKEATCHHAAARQCLTAHSNNHKNSHPRTRMGGASSSGLFARPRSIRLSPFPFARCQFARCFFNNDEDLQKWLSDFSKPLHFYRLGIEQLASRWKEVMNSEGEYIID
ncbi:hypothetical protein M513_07966, partial [Trichuris suis]